MQQGRSENHTGVLPGVPGAEAGASVPGVSAVTDDRARERPRRAAKKQRGDPACAGCGAAPCRLVGLSKGLAWLLRHGAGDAGVSMDSEGYVPVAEILALRHDKFCAARQAKVEDVLHVVEHNSKKRFEIAGDGDRLRVRASQGHSQVCMHACVCVCVFMSVCVCVCVCACMYVCMYVGRCW